MKNLLFAALLVGASAVEAAAQAPVLANDPASTTQTGKPKKRKYNPELYKGTVAKQRRIVTDANGAQNDKDEDASTAKGEKSSKKQ